MFRKLCTLVFLSLVGVLVAGCSGNVSGSKQEVRLIPKPLSLVATQESFSFGRNTHIVTGEAELAVANYLQGFVLAATGISLPVQSGAIDDKPSSIILKLVFPLAHTLGDEGYTLAIDKDRIAIEAATQAGLFYGVQSLRQLLPASYESQSGKAPIAVNLPGVNIEDKPRYPWRGLMLDEARHFQGKQVVFDLLDQMALMKMNRFHWHLTDYQGWRIEIKKYPKLTEIGGYRKDTEIGEPMGWGSGKFSGKPHNGHYTQEDIKEIIRYASERHIQIIPEIEMPGHSSAAIAAYPWLGFSNDPIEVPAENGKHTHVFNIADPKVIEFIHDVLDEVIALFPSDVIHIGGDEVAFENWKTSSEISQLMAEKGLTSYADLQVDFTNSISQYISSKGRRMMGWNEILGADIHGWHDENDANVKQELSKNSIVHFWKGDTKLIQDAAKQGYDIVNSIHSQTYLDYPYHAISLRKAYHFNPMPEGLSVDAQKRIMGIGAQVWTEFMPRREITESMIFPRLAAYAEVGWVGDETKDFKEFQLRIEPLVERWGAAGVAYNAEHLQESWLNRIKVLLFSLLLDGLA